jgi:LacI family transcriptional regulator
MAKPTLEEIGTLAGVSRSTVSRVVNNHLKVRADLRERVLKVIAETGYYPDTVARSLASHRSFSRRRSYIISLVIQETAQILFTDPYFAVLIQGIAEACNQNNYILTLVLFHLMKDNEELPTHMLQNQIFDAAIITTTQMDDMLIPHLIENQIPFVLVGSHSDPRVNSVDVDNQHGAYTVVEHLIRLGRRRIAIISGPSTNFTAEQRKQGYLNALQAHGLPIDETLIQTGGFSEVSGYECMQQLISLRPDAVFVASDVMAIGAMRAVRDEGILIPTDMALVGFDDLPLAAITDPQLTTVRQPIKQLGIQAVQTLIDILEQGPKPARRAVLNTKLVIRKSCGALSNLEGG